MTEKLEKRGEPKHRPGGGILRDAVYAAHDGIITTFAVVAGVIGADLSGGIVLVLGIANLIADGISMGAGNFLGLRSEQTFIKSEHAAEKQEIEDVPEEEQNEIREIYREKGFEGALLEQIVNTITADKERWAHIMLHEELGLSHPEDIRTMRNALVTFLSFLMAGTVPLVPYLIPWFEDMRFPASIFFTAFALFFVGGIRTIVMRGNIMLNALEVLLIGSLSGIAAYVIGFALRSLVNAA